MTEPGGAGPPRRLRSADGRRRLWVSPEWRDEAVLDAWLEPGGLSGALAAGTPTRRGRARSVRWDPGRGARLLLRPVRHGGLLAPLWGGRVLSTRRLGRELRVTALLRERGAPVPRAWIAAAEWRAPGWSALMATEWIDPGLDALAWLEGRPQARELARGAFLAGAALRRFHDAGGRHPDLHAGNLLVQTGDDGGPEGVLVVDLDRARAGPPPPPGRRARELGRLARSLRKHGLLESVWPRAAARFVAGYCGDDRALRRALARRWPRERARMALHALAYPAAREDAGAAGRGR